MAAHTPKHTPSLPHPDWLTPDWPAPAHVRALCTTRAGGVSLGPCASMNLGNHVADDPQAVAVNRARLAASMAARPVFLNQVHGTRMLDLDANSANSADGQDADGAFTRQAGVACTVMVADCLPVLLCETGGTAVAAVHAGWRGLAGEGGQGVLEVIYKRFSAPALVETAQAATDLIAWLGPCIGPQAFEVGPEVRAAFVDHAAQAADCFTPLPGGKWLADLPGLARQRLQALGVGRVYGNDSSAPWCTVANASRFFSYRRDGVSGRLAACIWLA
jgi:YfiH family protein